jgi:hypothetical protein
MSDLRIHPVHLGLGGSAAEQPAFDGMAWYEAYAQRTASDGVDGRLVSLYEFASDWESWEMHPAGDELVVCLEGAITLIQELPDGRFHSTVLRPCEYAINPAGTWHTADVAEPTKALFITAGQDTEHRPR